MVDSTKVINVIIAIILPPLSVFLARGAGRDLLINIVLCIFIWFPAILHAVYIAVSS
ncbi:hypothetical protein WICANDRAFT_61906 [Wickerhamomyces anomalus NRRL Y-366-8]|uniref:Plasma membrane proteolipid 3 n=1 Tax=Wickerhamomyces anomalus (strain ATCC 58044 / CBS 1984 / NCYC 433 / NRRL Y-366-8) TaxID=683960 RepID=A0A1E3P7E8_WICAA|nr:uncharacterized protein WICANDRAFT_61906 [Wickerhamomyces anomalus NRRL Y-366-8]ODQ61349.1 hypothetical protein WICANDRAFT_61906 [Wickerhamomyces anomalus NRRL Y-366-8]